MPGEDVIEPLEGIGVERDVKGPDCGVELFLGPRSHDRRRDGGLVQQPGEGDVTGFLAQLIGKVLVLLDLVLVLLERFRGASLGPPDALLLLLQHAAQEAALERGPWDEPQPVLLGRRDDLKFHLAHEQVIDGLLADQPGVVPPPRRFLRLGNVPPCEVAAA